MISDNFVKRNLKRKHGGSFYKKSNFLKRRKDNDEAEVLPNHSEREDIPQTSNAKSKEGFGGISVWGVDPLAFSVDWVSKQQVGVEFAKKEVNNSINAIASTRSIRGLQSNNNSGLKDDVFFDDSRTFSDEQLEVAQQYAPKCTGHQMLAKLCKVNKTGDNKGRYFYGCTYPADQRCSFFMWVENNPRILESELFTKTSNRDVEYAFELYKRKLLTLNRDQLLQEAKLYNRRMLTFAKMRSSILPMRLFDSVRTRKKLMVGSAKQDLFQKIFEEAKWWYYQYQCTFHPLRHNYQFAGDISQVELSQGEEEDIIFLSDSDDSKQEACSPEQTKSKLFFVNNKGEVKNKEEEDDDDDDGDDDSANYWEEMESVNQVDTSTNSDLTQAIACWCFGHTFFREGQKWTIDRILSGKNTLAVMPTGYGKSICYLVPSLLSEGLTIVVSPLIALMNDQLSKLPVELPGYCLTSQLSTIQYVELCFAIISKKLKVLYVSPERLCSTAFRKLIHMIKANVDQGVDAKSSTSNIISLLCVDEAHCLSQWSYNFRPAFLRIRREIKFIQPRSILALTATANKKVQEDIRHYLNIEYDGVRVIANSRNNLLLSAHFVHDNEEKYQFVQNNLKLSQSSDIQNSRLRKQKEKCPLSIVYVWKRMDAESLSDFLRAADIPNAVYHGGLDSSQRELIQKRFDRGQARCIVATVAFGMGIDKSDVRKVIHFSLPKSIENYLQEVGRAGRDNILAECKLFFSKADALQQYCLSQSNRISQLQLLALLLTIFPFSIKPASSSMVSFDLQEIEQKLDLTESQIETVLSLLELSPFQFIEIDRIHLNKIKGKFRVVGDKLITLCEEYPIVKAIMKSQQSVVNNAKKNESICSSHELSTNSSKSINTSSERLMGYTVEFEVSRSVLAQELQIEIDEVGKQLYHLQSQGKIEYTLSDNAIRFQFVDESLQQLRRFSWVSFNDYQRWIIHIAKQLFEMLDCFQDQISHNVIKMWKFGSLLSSVTKLSQSEVTMASDLAILSSTMQAVAMEAMNEQYENKVIISDSSFEGPDFDVSLGLVDVSIEKCLKWYHAIPSPCSQSASLKEDIKKKVFVLSKEPSLVGLADRVSKVSINCLIPKRDSGSDNGPNCSKDIQPMKEVILVLRRELLTLYICKVFLGIGSYSLPQNVWSAGMYAEYWAVYKDCDYHYLYQTVSSCLAKR